MPTALKRLVHRLVGDAEADLDVIARRVMILLVTATRLSAIACGGVLMRDGDASGPLTTATGLGGVVWVLGSTVFDLRTRGGTPHRDGWILLGDVAVLTAGMALSGGVDSPVRLLVVVLPIAAGLILRPVGVLLNALAVLLGYALLASPGRPLAVLAIAVGWGTLVGMTVAWARHRALGRLSRVDAVRRSVLRRGGGDERLALGRELRAAALDPLLAVARRIDGAGPAELRALGEEIAATATRLRSIVVELHVLTARQGGLRASLEGLAQRRCAAAEVRIDVPGALGAEEVALATDVVREALRTVATPATTELDITVAPTGDGLLVTATAVPAVRVPAEQGQAFAEHVALLGGLEPELSPGSVRVLMRDEQAPVVPTWAPNRTLQDLRALMTVLSIPSVLAALAAGAVAGGPRPAYYVAGAAATAWGPVIIRTASAPDATLGRWLLTALPQLAALVVMIATVGDALGPLLPLIVAIAPCYGLNLAPALTFAMSTLAGTAIVLAGADGLGFIAAFAWATLVAVILSAGVKALDVSLARVVAARRALVRRLTEENDRERRRIAERMHDETLQTLLATRQDLDEAADGDEEARALAAGGVERAIASLRVAAGDLDAEADAAPEGPERALRALASAVAERGGPYVALALEPAATGHHDGLVVRLARELVANAVEHANADRVLVRLSRAGDRVVLEVADDGRGADLARVRDAVERGHVGLASCRERAAAAGGTLVLAAGDEGGTRVRVQLPVRGR